MAKENFRTKPKKGHFSKVRGKVSPGQPNMNTMNRNPNLRTPGSAKSLLGTGNSFQWSWDSSNYGMDLQVQGDCYGWIPTKCRCNCVYHIQRSAITPDWMDGGYCKDNSGMFAGQPFQFYNDEAYVTHLLNDIGNMNCFWDSDCHNDCVQACEQFGNQHLGGTCYDTPHGGY